MVLGTSISPSVDYGGSQESLVGGDHWHSSIQDRLLE